MEKQVFIVSCVATRTAEIGTSIRHRALLVKALNNDEAAGIAFRILTSEIAPIRDGWGNHDVTPAPYSEIEITV